MSDTPTNLPQAAVAALWKGQKIEAIKILRGEHNLDLHDAKQAVDAYVKGEPALQKRLAEAQAETRKECVMWFIPILVILAGMYYFLAGK
jgi:ribosomal protein L7/L12